MTTGRRQFLKASVLSGLGLAVGSKSFANFSPAKNPQVDNGLPLPTFPQMEWQDCELGLLYSFDIGIAAKQYAPNNYIQTTFDPNVYAPARLDTDQWLRAAKAAGATYAIFTATHFSGFMQWQSDLYPYGLKQAKWKNGKGDVVADFIQSCYKYGIKPGIYLSTHRNAYWHVDNFYVDWGKGKGTKKQEEFNRICEKMTEELCSRYGRLIQIWYDAGVKTPAEGGPNVLPIFDKYQPNGIFYNSSQRSDFRWIGNEEGHADYPCWATMPGGSVSHNSSAWKKILGGGDQNGSVWSPAMVDIPLRGANGIHNWFWKPDQEQGVYSVQQLTKIYMRSVGRNSNMVVGIPINSDGLVPATDTRRLAAFGKALREQFSPPLGSTKGRGKDFVIDLGMLQSLKQYVLQEDIQFGERVQSYFIKGKLADGSWMDIDKGSCIGHKRIGQIGRSERFHQVVLKILESKDKPLIRQFSIY